MPTDVNRIAQGLAAAWSSVDAEKIVSFFADDCVFEDVCVGYVCHGKEELKNRANAIFAKVLDSFLSKLARTVIQNETDLLCFVNF